MGKEAEQAEGLDPQQVRGQWHKPQTRARHKCKRLGIELQTIRSAYKIKYGDSWNCEGVARVLEISRRTLNRAEKEGHMTITTLLALCGLYKVSPVDIFEVIGYGRAE